MRVVTSTGTPAASLDPGTRSANGSAAAIDEGADPLVQAEWLLPRLGRPGLALLHVDNDSSTYYGTHLPGALPVDWHDELNEQVQRAPVSRPHFEELLERKGIDRGTHVVLYGTGDGAFAAYAYWLFRYYQHPRVSLLDGGLRAWARAGGQLATEVPAVDVEGSYRSPGPDQRLRVQRDEMVGHYATGPEGAAVLDCRTPAEYAGRHHHPLDLAVEHHRVGGHVPGARNVPSSLVLTAEDTFRSVTQLRAIFAEAGVQADTDVVVYCRVAERSSLLWFALHELLGHPRVRHYDGGWSEYGSLLDVPVERDG